MTSTYVLTRGDFYYPVGVCVEGVFYGFYTAVFAASLWVEKRRSRYGSAAGLAGNVYFCLIIPMWIVASFHFGISLQRFLRVYILEFRMDSAPAAVRLLDSGRWDTLAHMILTTLMIWLGDVLVIYRTFVVWERRILVVAVPILVHVAYIVINSMAIFALSHPAIIPRATAIIWYRPVFPLLFAQNVMTTGLLFYKTFHRYRSSKAKNVINVTPHISSAQLPWMIIETAVLYTIELFVIICLGVVEHPSKGIVSLSLVPTLGIVFVLLSVRVHFGDSQARYDGGSTSDPLGHIPNLFPELTTDADLEGSQNNPSHT